MAHVDDEIARLARDDGYYVVARDERLVELEQKNSWLAVFLMAMLSGNGPSPSRVNRLYLEVDEHGDAVVRLRRPQPTS